MKNEIPTNSFITRLKFAYGWDMRAVVLNKMFLETLDIVGEGIRALFVGSINMLFGFIGLIVMLPIWVLRPLFMAVFQGESVDKVIASGIGKNQK